MHHVPEHSPASRRLVRFGRALLVTTVLGAGSAQAEDLGVIGPTYQIKEPHAIQWVEARMKEMEKSGEYMRVMEAHSKRIIDGIRNPPPLPGLSEAERSLTYYWDPTYTVPKNITDDKGRILYPAGYTFNPLQIRPMGKHMLFFDGSDKRQRKFARGIVEHYQGKVKPILVAGSPFDVMKEWRLRVYFDQMGLLTSKFGIRHVPALVTQEGQRLRIDELKVPLGGGE